MRDRFLESLAAAVDDPDGALREPGGEGEAPAAAAEESLGAPVEAAAGRLAEGETP